MNQSLLSYLPVIADAAKPYFEWAFTLLLAWFLIVQFKKIGKTPEGREIIDFLMRHAKAAYREFERTIHPPGMKKRPKLVLFIGAALAGVWYVYSGSLFLCSVIMWWLIYTTPTLPLMGFYTCMAYGAVCLLASFYFWGAAQRDRMNLNKRWRKLLASDLRKKSAPSSAT